MAETHVSSDSSALYKQLDEYGWDHDKEFQAALASILKSASTPDQAAHLTTRARCYYFTRKYKVPVNFEGYQSWLQSQSPHQQLSELGHATSSEAPPHTPSIGDAPPPASFAEICELIAEGKPIPGIKDIPDTVLEGQGTQAQAPARKKPWEKDATPAPTPSWAR